MIWIRIRIRILHQQGEGGKGENSSKRDTRRNSRASTLFSAQAVNPPHPHNHPTTTPQAHPPYIPMDDTAAAAAVVAHFGLDGPSGSEPSPVLPAEAEAEYPSLGQVQGLEEEEREQVLLRVSGQALRCLRFTAKLLSACQAALGLPHDAVEDVVASGMTLSGDGAGRLC